MGRLFRPERTKVLIKRAKSYGIVNLCVLYTLCGESMKNVIPAIISLCEHWLLERGWRRTTMILATCGAYVGYHVVALLSGGFEPFFFTINFFLIVLIGASLGIWGAMAAATVTGILWGPFAALFVHIPHATPTVFWIFRVLVFELFGLLSGTVASVFRHQVRVQRETNEQLIQAQKLETIGLLTGGIAHDFNNMLTAIGGYTDLLVSSASPHAEIKPFATELLDVVRRSYSLTHQLLAISRQRRTDTRPIDPEDEIRSLGKVLGRIIGEKIDLQFSFASKLWTIDADPVQIDQIIMNLAVNAADAMPNGGRLAVSVKNLAVDSVFASQHPSLKVGDYVLITVSDTGSGIAKQDAHRIFEPFYTTKEAGKGTGLGLPTVRGIVRELKGDIWFQTVMGRGTSFKVCLPRTHSKPERKRLAVDGSGRRLARPEESVAKVLVAEDDDAVRLVITRLLAHEGYEVISVEDGEQALEVIRDPERRIDLVITDVVMPKESGLVVLENVYKLRPTVGVIAISGYSQEEWVKIEISALADGFLEKPFNGHELLSTARQILG